MFAEVMYEEIFANIQMYGAVSLRTHVVRNSDRLEWVGGSGNCLLVSKSMLVNLMKRELGTKWCARQKSRFRDDCSR